MLNVKRHVLLYCSTIVILLFRSNKRRFFLIHIVCWSLMAIAVSERRTSFRIHNTIHTRQLVHSCAMKLCPDLFPTFTVSKAEVHSRYLRGNSFQSRELHFWRFFSRSPTANNATQIFPPSRRIHQTDQTRPEAFPSGRMIVLFLPGEARGPLSSAALGPEPTATCVRSNNR